jgi:ribosomal protein S19
MFLLSGCLNIDRIAFPKIIAGQQTPAVKTQARAATILPSFVGLTFQVHNGKDYVEFLVTEDMVGHKLGEFSM